VADQAKNANAIVDEAHDTGLDGSHPVTLQAKMLRLELLNVKADLERELGRLVLHCTFTDSPSGPPHALISSCGLSLRRRRPSFGVHH
jgi:hypothetical protein